MRKSFTFLIVMIALVAGLYTQRVAILEWYESTTKPALPEAVSYVETQEEDVVEEEVIEEDVEVVELVEEEVVLEEEVVVEEVEEVLEESEEEEVEEYESALPASLNLAVPFTSQAPHGNWDEPYQESCEEASVYMVHSYYEGVPEGRVPADDADLDLLQIVAFEEELFGFYEDTTAEQTGVFAELMFGYTYELVEDPTVEQIKTHIAEGRPVIVPAAGRLLGNPYFTAPGPIYHMLVIRGYTQDDQFIVNDPGTKHGEAYLYAFDDLLYAMHDWNHGGEITQGRKVILVLHP